MKTKQLPYDFDSWIKERTFVIGAEATVEPDSRRVTRQTSHPGKEPNRAQRKWKEQNSQRVFRVNGPDWAVIRRAVVSRS
jgi:hypothetical protein